jgi:hypothetical protein
VPVDRRRSVHFVRFHADATPQFKESVQSDLAAVGLIAKATIGSLRQSEKWNADLDAMAETRAITPPAA